MSRAATIALTMASSVACTVASNSGSTWSLPIEVDCASGAPASAAAFAVEKAMKMSPEPLPAIAAHACEAECGASREALQLVRQQRRVGAPRR